MPKEEAPGAGLNDFVKKLYQMLLQNKYHDVVRWTPPGNSFVVLDTNEFTKVILPTHFKHSNFASFVRQLNKYDFHKVKISLEERQNYQYGDDAWEFQHPDFKRDGMDALENIRRKAPLKKETPQETSPAVAQQMHQLRQEVGRLLADLEAQNRKARALHDSLAAVRAYNERHARSMDVLVHCLLAAGIKIPPLDLPNPNLAALALAPPPLAPQHVPGSPSVAAAAAAAAATQADSKLHLRHQLTDLGRFEPAAAGPGKAKFHVLLVEDDNVCIQLCRKFLMKYGCEVTVVTDGLNAISTVEDTKYDLVLMDIVMPNLDGATATSIIRLFDTKTPIIAMTGNIQDNDLVTYLQNGMSDILAKPFTKNDLFLILSKYLLTKRPFDDTEFRNLPMDSPPGTVPLAPAMSLPPTPSAVLGASLDLLEPVEKKPRLQ